MNCKLGETQAIVKVTLEMEWAARLLIENSCKEGGLEGDVPGNELRTVMKGRYVTLSGQV